MKHEILVGDVLAGLRAMPDASVQCVVTSPPYWGLRDYGVEGQIGLEPTPDGYVERMVGVFREVRRVLRDDGVLWLNLGDSYSTHAAGVVEDPMAKSTLAGVRTQVVANRSSRAMGVYLKCKSLPEKNLVGIPWRVAFALQADGWYLRSDIIWSKPNPMPESVTDRPTKSHEYVFLLTKRARYFYDADAIHEPANSDRVRGPALHPSKDTNGNAGLCRRTVWKIATQSTPEAHFATFPEALVEPCIKAGTSERGCCPTCGAPWEREVETTRVPDPGRRAVRQRRPDEAWNAGRGQPPHTGYRGLRDSVTTGWRPTCTCDTGDPVPCVVLDPFGGSGTVAKVARDLGRSSVLIELNPEYVGIAKKRLRVGEQLDTGVCEYAVREVGA